MLGRKLFSQLGHTGIVWRERLQVLILAGGSKIQYSKLDKSKYILLLGTGTN